MSTDIALTREMKKSNDEIEVGAIFTDSRDESEEWYVKYADEEVVVSRKTDERYHKFNRREAFDKMAGLDDIAGLDSRFTFTGEIKSDEPEESENETKSLLDL